MTTALMEPGRFAYLVAYDVADDGRRQELAEFLADLGGTRAQRSVFWVRLDPAGLVRLRAGAGAIIDEDADRVHWYRTCGNCPGPVAQFGVAGTAPSDTREAGWIV